MNDYYKVRIDATPCSEDITDLVAAFLAEHEFESFEPDENGLNAYVKAEGADGAELARMALTEFPMPVEFNISQTFVEGKDWNEEWEKHYFKPIVIDGRCVIHSSFHSDVPRAEYDIVIDPKMAFGTGHHDTTSNMVRLILGEDMRGRAVIDVGTGTGILGILAAMRGASNVTGIEIDQFAYENAIENVALNHVNMELIHGDAGALMKSTPADYLFANINRNIILNDIALYAEALKPGGSMFLSGFYEDDASMINEAARKYGLKEIKRFASPSKWMALHLVKTQEKQV